MFCSVQKFFNITAYIILQVKNVRYVHTVQNRFCLYFSKFQMTLTHYNHGDGNTIIKAVPSQSPWNQKKI